MACRTGCPTKEHASWGECARDMNLRIAYANSANGWDLSKQKQWDKELADYRSAVAQGIQPANTDRRSIDRAVRISNETGQAYTG
jgi:hypothetical protein